MGGSNSNKHITKDNAKVNMGAYYHNFGILHTQVTDNGGQISVRRIPTFDKKCSITHHKSTPLYPQENGQADTTNKTIYNLNKKLEKYEERWADEFPNVLGAYTRTRTSETLFSFFHEKEVGIHTKLAFCTTWTGAVKHGLKDDILTHNNYNITEKLMKATIRLTRYHLILPWSYNKSIKERVFQPR